MLQIITEKFFPPGERYVTTHRANFYTNYRVLGGSRIETPVGILLPSTDHLSFSTLTCEMIEKQVKFPDGPRPGVLVATSGNELLNDFAAVIAFFLNVTCTLDHDLTRRLLLSDRPSLGVEAIPSQFIGRMFDRGVLAREEDAEALSHFVAKLIGLERKSFEGAMRAIRQFVTGSHRIADDLNLAYTLFVTSIESLAQEFDGHVAVWSDYDHRKRKRIDDALAGTPEPTSEAVRQAILANEHVAASRRFRDFAMAHLAPTFFRGESADVHGPISRPDLPNLLRHAYDIRSRYVHSLHDIPRQLTMQGLHETVDADNRLALSFAGLARLARHIILQFIDRGRAVETETFAYRMALPGIVRMKLSSEYWIASTGGFDHKTARARLAAFLEQITTAVLLRQPKASITDLRPILTLVEKLVPGLRKPSQRLPLLALYVLFNKIAPADARCANWTAFVEPYKADFDAPTIESFVTLLIIESPIEWSLEQLEGLCTHHFDIRHTANAVDIGRLLEAALLLLVAERNRLSGNPERARQLIALAVEAHPGHTGLRVFEAALPAVELPDINWATILLPPPSAAQEQFEDQDRPAAEAVMS